jgi:thioredoxin 1
MHMLAKINRCRIVWSFPICCLAMAALAGGCNAKVINPTNTAQFDSQVVRANRPALVLFYKDGCALCGMMSPIMDRLADEYDGKATFANYRLLNLVFISTNPELRDRYEIWGYPTTVLFVDGQVKKKWIMDYSMADYRKALNEALGIQTTQPTAAQPTPVDKGEPTAARSPGR